MEVPEREQKAESNRLKVLHETGIMDSAPELSFDQLALLASKVCQTPVALISFINSTRQWFKATYGLDVKELPKLLSACNKALLVDHSYEIQDADAPDNPYRDFMMDNGFRYYAGVPISSADDYHLGTLCVIDYKPRKMSSEQLLALEAISRQISELLEIRRKYVENLETLKEIGESSYKKDKYFQEVVYKSRMRALADLSAGISFKIRPLVLNIDAMAQQLRLTPEQKEVLSNATSGITEIFDALDKFIDAEKEKSMRAIEVKGVIEAVLNHLEYRIKEHDITVHVSSPGIDHLCVGNTSQLTQVFFEVVNNAIEAVIGMEKREITIGLDEYDHKIIVKVCDSGKGIPDNVAPFIFQPLFTTKGLNSIGTGLCLAQTLVQLHSGEIILEKSYGPTTFAIILPRP